MVWVQSSGRALDVRNDWRGPRIPLLELLGIVGDRLRDVGRPEWELESESGLAAVFIRSVVGWENWGWGAMSGAARQAEGFGTRVLGSDCAVHTDLASGDAQLAITEDVGLGHC